MSQLCWDTLILTLQGIQPALRLPMPPSWEQKVLRTLQGCIQQFKWREKVAWNGMVCFGVLRLLALSSGIWLEWAKWSAYLAPGHCALAHLCGLISREGSGWAHTAAIRAALWPIVWAISWWGDAGGYGIYLTVGTWFNNFEELGYPVVVLVRPKAPEGIKCLSWGFKERWSGRHMWSKKGKCFNLLRHLSCKNNVCFVSITLA